MCGIAGICSRSYNGPPVDLQRMVDAMRHRGPDDRGLVNLGTHEGACRLGNTRLAIIDTSEAGRMPMLDPQSGNWIVYNGEIYNFQQLREELRQLGYTFRTGTDTEVILACYRRYGAGFLKLLRGMFALAIWDESRRQLLLARDRMGIKPLYYHEGAGTFAFASEVRALLASGLVDRRLDSVALKCYLWNGFVVSPHTIVDGVRALLPGHWMRVDSEGRIVARGRFWSLKTKESIESSNAVSVEEARARLREAVQIRLISDVSLGAFLSGGLDSSTVVALMALQENDIRTYSITFDEPDYDESTFSRWIAERYATKHTEIRLRRDDFFAWLPSALGALDQPSFDGINTYCISRAVRDAGLRVALSGLGADELFGGYPFLNTIPWLQRLSRLSHYVPLPIPDLMQSGLRTSLGPVSGPWKSLDALGHQIPEDLQTIAAYQWSQMLFPSWSRKKLLLNSTDVELEDPMLGLPGEFIDFMKSEIPSGNPLGQVLYATQRLFLGERTLRDTDSMSMGVSLEVRAPFTDHKFVESIISIPPKIRARGAPNKPFELELVGEFLGEDFPPRRKQGFIFPFEAWLRDPRAESMIRNTLSDKSLAESIGFHPEAVMTLVERFYAKNAGVPWSRVWALFALFDWCRRHKVSA